MRYVKIRGITFKVEGTTLKTLIIVCSHTNFRGVCIECANMWRIIPEEELDAIIFPKSEYIYAEDIISEEKKMELNDYIKNWKLKKTGI